MSIRPTATLVLTAALLTTGAVPSAAAPASGRVVAFVGDALPVRVWEDPSGCHPLPAGTHVVFNETDRAIVVYTDPLCLFPLEPAARLEPGRGSHVSTVGSFRA